MTFVWGIIIGIVIVIIATMLLLAYYYCTHKPKQCQRYGKNIHDIVRGKHRLMRGHLHGGPSIDGQEIPEFTSVTGIPEGTKCYFGLKIEPKTETEMYIMTYGTVRKGKFEPKIDHWLMPKTQDVTRDFLKYKGYSICMAATIDGKIKSMITNNDPEYSVTFVRLKGDYYQVIRSMYRFD